MIRRWPSLRVRCSYNRITLRQLAYSRVYVHRRQGQLELSLEELTKALEHDPRNAALAENRADIYCQTRESVESATPAPGRDRDTTRTESSACEVCS